MKIKFSDNFIYLLKKSTPFIFFLLFIIIPISKLQKNRVLLTEARNSLKDFTKQEQIFRTKLLNIKKSQKDKEASLLKYKEDLYKTSFSSPAELKIVIEDRMKKFNLTLLTIYRIEKDDISELLNSDTPIYKISIPYEINGSFESYYNFLLSFSNSEKHIFFNNHTLTINYKDFNEVNIKFYVSTAIFF